MHEGQDIHGNRVVKLERALFSSPVLRLLRAEGHELQQQIPDLSVVVAGLEVSERQRVALGHELESGLQLASSEIMSARLTAWPLSLDDVTLSSVFGGMRPPGLACPIARMRLSKRPVDVFVRNLDRDLHDAPFENRP